MDYDDEIVFIQNMSNFENFGRLMRSFNSSYSVHPLWRESAVYCIIFDRIELGCSYRRSD